MDVSKEMRYVVFYLKLNTGVNYEHDHNINEKNKRMFRPHFMMVVLTQTI